MKVFNENKEEDSIELSHRLDDIRAEMEYPFFTPLCDYGCMIHNSAELSAKDECILWVWSSSIG